LKWEYADGCRVWNICTDKWEKVKAMWPWIGYHGAAMRSWLEAEKGKSFQQEETKERSIR